MPLQTSPIYEQAKKYAELGFSVIPIKKIPGDLKQSKQSIVSWGQHMLRKATEEELYKWFVLNQYFQGYHKQWEKIKCDLNIAIVCGNISDNLVCLDFDMEGTFEKWASDVLGKRTTPIAKTGKGYHVLVKVKDYDDNGNLIDCPGNYGRAFHNETRIGETRGQGGYFVTEPSVHGSGYEYKWIVRPETTPILEIRNLEEIQIYNNYDEMMELNQINKSENNEKENNKKTIIEINLKDPIKEATNAKNNTKNSSSTKNDNKAKVIDQVNKYTSNFKCEVALRSLTGLINDYELFYKIILICKNILKIPYEKIDPIFKDTEGYDYKNNLQIYNASKPRNNADNRLKEGSLIYYAKKLNHEGYKRISKELRKELKETGAISSSASNIHDIEDFLDLNYKFRYNTITKRMEYKSMLDDDIDIHEFDNDNNEDEEEDSRKKRNEIIANDPDFKSYKVMSDRDLNSISLEMNRNNLTMTPSRLVEIINSDFAASYDPFKVYYNNLPDWNEDEPDYIRLLSNTVIFKDKRTSEVFYNYLKKFLVATVAAHLDENVVNHAMLIFQSTAQGVGKTSWMNNLAPKQLTEYMAELKISQENKDDIVKISNSFMINLDELACLNKVDIEYLKTIITMKGTSMRKAYGRIEEYYTHRASFVGTINHEKFLTDATGNRRFLVFSIKKVLFEQLNALNMDLVYSQAYKLYLTGFKYWFDLDDINEINRRNKQFEQSSNEEELIHKYFRPIKNNNKGAIPEYYFTSTEILDKLNIFTRGRIHLNNIMVGKALSKLGFKSVKHKGRYMYPVVTTQEYKNTIVDEVQYNGRTLSITNN